MSGSVFQQVQESMATMGKVSHLGKVGIEHYQSAYQKGWRKRLLAKLTGQSRRLLELSSFCLSEGYDMGLAIIPIKQIKGTMQRSQDFDRDFYPTQKHTIARWLSIFRAYSQELSLPPIEVIQLADTYFVEDGHHRVSVARTLGILYIEAHVKVVQIAP